MSAIRSKDTKPELIVRRGLWALGIRYRLHSDVVGRPDLVIRRTRVAVFVDGDFWHGNPEEWRRRRMGSMDEMFPSRTAWWVAKIERNIARDREVTRRLVADGWRVIRVWESEVLRDATGVVRRIARAIRKMEGGTKAAGGTPGRGEEVHRRRPR
jgi:DNA mismatch endonuclease (patch repair protein)